MKEYLKNTILEQINRGKYLKALIPHPLKYDELSRLAVRCSMIIDDNVQKLNYLNSELSKRNEDDIRDIFRGFRICARSLELVEYYGISALSYETPEIGYLNRLIIKIHKEINLPLSPPTVACISTSYYYFHPITNVVFVPVGESNSLLHLPDVFHEIGHEVLFNKENELKLKKINESFHTAINKITKYYNGLLSQKQREYGPLGRSMTIAHIYSQWKDYWIEEFFSDLFALYTLGPAYAWAHLHLTAKKSENIYEFSDILPQKHPSDDARMKMLIMGLEISGFQNDSRQIWSKWQDLPLSTNTQPIIEYQNAYPDDLMREIANTFYNGLNESKFSIITFDKLSQLNEKQVTKILNDAWNLFWGKPEDFREWEEKQIEKLKQELHVE